MALTISAPRPVDRAEEILTPEALAFIERELVAGILAEETEKLRGEVGEDAFAKHYLPASKLIGDICLSEEYTDFLTTPAYELVG